MEQGSTRGGISSIGTARISIKRVENRGSDTVKYISYFHELNALSTTVFYGSGHPHVCHRFDQSMWMILVANHYDFDVTKYRPSMQEIIGIPDRTAGKLTYSKIKQNLPSNTTISNSAVKSPQNGTSEQLDNQV